jgi:hypothetical protein
VRVSQSKVWGAMLLGAPRSPDLCVEPAGVSQALLGAGRLTLEEDHGAVEVGLKRFQIGPES